MTNLINPKIERFVNPSFKSMDQYNELKKRFETNYEETWAELAKTNLDWIEPFTNTLNQDNPPFYKWFEGGKLNVADQCLKNHLNKNKIAIKFEGDRGDTREISYDQLNEEVNKTANLLKTQFNIVKGDRVILYLPMIPESIYSILACAKIGAIHSIVFGGFSAEALRDRIEDAQAKLVITADGAFRKGKAYMLKPIVDKALEKDCNSVENVCVIKRNNEPINWNEKDNDYNELIKLQSVECESEVMDSEDPLFLLYTSGSTGKPKGVQHSSAGYILWAKLTTQWVFDIQDNDTYWCAADIGWITGHTYIVYGPLAAGATSFLFEGVPTGDNSGRCFELIEKYNITQFYTAPTVIRMLQKIDENAPERYNLESLKILGTVGEPIDEAAWDWYYTKVGNKQSSIVDTYWQTETGGHIITPLPAITPFKPGCATLPLPGIQAQVLNKDGSQTKVGETGLLCVTKPWPSMIRTIWGDDERFKETYFQNQTTYFTGDGATMDENGYITITGRVDDVINMSGHRFGTAEIEDSIKKHHAIAAVAVVGRPHGIKGEDIAAFLVLKDPQANIDKIEHEINENLKKEIGAIVRCEDMTIVPDLPKTRSGKIMRRLLRSIARGEKITQDISTLENPAIVAEIESIFSNNNSFKQ